MESEISIFITKENEMFSLDNEIFILLHIVKVASSLGLKFYSIDSNSE